MRGSVRMGLDDKWQPPDPAVPEAILDFLVKGHDKSPPTSIRR